MDVAMESALREISALLQPDGFRLDRHPSTSRVELRVVANDQACGECLVPKQVMRTIIMNVFQRHGATIEPEDLVLMYPNDPDVL